MRSDPKHGMAFAALMALAVVGISAAALIGSVSADPGDYDQDMGSFHSMSCRFIYTGEGADVVTWDFGDGTETITGMNVDHTFAAVGVYYVTQTATNDIGSTVAIYRVEILGYPTVTYDLGYDGQKTVVVQDAYNVATKTIADPVRSGFTFGGWFSDTSYATAYDFSSENKLTAPVTIYAKWTSVIVTPEPDDNTDSELDSKIMILVALVGLIALVAGLAGGKPVVAIIGIILLAFVALIHFEVFEWPL